MCRISVFKSLLTYFYNLRDIFGYTLSYFYLHYYYKVNTIDTSEQTYRNSTVFPILNTNLYHCDMMAFISKLVVHQNEWIRLLSKLQP